MISQWNDKQYCKDVLYDYLDNAFYLLLILLSKLEQMTRDVPSVSYLHMPVKAKIIKNNSKNSAEPDDICDFIRSYPVESLFLIQDFV